MKKDQQEIKVTYHYIEPKTEAEAQEAKRRLNAVFDMLFEGIIAEELSQNKPGEKD